jgi:F0F1-type ATP synthase assembly protein I
MEGSSGRRPATSGSASGLGPAYQGGVEAGLAVVIAMGFGLWADSHFETSPVGLFVGLGIGVGAFALRITRLLRDTSGPPTELSGPSKAPEGETERPLQPERKHERDGPTK